VSDLEKALKLQPFQGVAMPGAEKPGPGRQHRPHGGCNIILLECIEIMGFFGPMTSASATSLPVLAVITNAGSTANKAGDWIDPLLAGEPGVLHLKTTGAADIDAAVAQAAAHRAEVVVVNGGDGTVDLTFGALLNGKHFTTQPAVALLSAGKTNMTAAAWSCGGDKTDAMRRVLAARREGALAGHAKPRHILTVDRGDGSAPLRGAFLGAADVVNGILFCREHIYPLSLPNAVSHTLAIGLLLWRGLFSGARAEPLEAAWRDGGEHGSFFFVSATTLDKLVLGLAPQPDHGEGALTYLSLRGGPGAMLAVMPKLLTKTFSTGTGRIVRRTDEMKLSFDGAYTLDGELFEASRNRPLTISARETLPIVRLP